VTYPCEKIHRNGLIVIGDLPRRKKNAKNFSSGLLVTGDMPDGEKKKECEEFCKWSIYSRRPA